MIQLLPIVLAQVALLVGGPVTVNCESGFAKHGRDGDATAATMTIRVDAGNVCAPMNQFARRPNPPRAESIWDWNRAASNAWALFILGHEAAHIKHPEYPQAWEEAKATCAGLGNLPSFARALGASRSTARWLQRVARYRVRTDMPEQYQSACTQGR